MEAQNRVILFTGAGASSCFGFPTTQQFITSLRDELSKKDDDPFFQNSDLVLLNQILNNKDFRDIEHVLELLDILKGVNKPRFLSFINQYYAQVNLGNNNQGLDFRIFLNNANTLRSKIQRDIFRQYEFNPAALPRINEIYVPLIRALFFLNKNSPLSIFTTNYDQIIENACSKNNILLIDGFKRMSKADDECEWNPEEYYEEITEKNSPLVRLYKLHGSLNWRERVVDGKTVRVSTEELTIGSRRYRKNYVIYPAEKFKPEIDPFKKLHEMFVNEYLKCDTAIFLGFAFRDDYLNSVINQATSKKQIIIISRHASDFVQNNKDRFKPSLIPIDFTFGEEIDKLISKIVKYIT